MGKRLAIRGHSTRGKEVIELLEMMGGHADDLLDNGIDEKYAYFIVNDENNVIDAFPIYKKDEFDFDVQIFTLEEFLEKYPYKVGDKIPDIWGTSLTVKSMNWDENYKTVMYGFEDAVFVARGDELYMTNIINNHTEPSKMKNVLAELLEHIKTTPKEELEKEFKEIEEWSNVGPTVEEFMTFCEYVNKKPVYPTTYEECCKNVLGLVHWGMTVDVPMHYSPLIINFTKLLICRDAYWEIAGDEMGLDKPWEPDWNDGELKWCMSYSGKYIEFDQYKFKHHILVFPTAEMRNAFYENFKDLIEQCKELL